MFILKFKGCQDDPTDDKFIETALNGKADYIVTQDRHYTCKLFFRNNYY